LNAAEEIRLIAGAKHGDQGSFEALVHRFMGKAMAVAMTYVGNREDALDLAQEAFYRVYKSLGRFVEGEPFAPWFFRILRNACLNFLERRRRGRAFSIHAKDQEEDDYPLVDDDAQAPLDSVEASEEQRQLIKALHELPLKHREIIWLRHFEELDYASIAKVLDIPIGTVMSRLFHARQRLKAALEPYMESRT
jgi:RNA polymerase sigma-70 factor (ECF subfamily)